MNLVINGKGLLDVRGGNEVVLALHLTTLLWEIQNYIQNTLNNIMLIQWMCPAPSDLFVAMLHIIMPTGSREKEGSHTPLLTRSTAAAVKRSVFTSAKMG